MPSIITGEIGSWTHFTPTGNWVTNTTYDGYYRVVGKSLQLRVKITLTGAPDATNCLVNLPPGFTGDQTVVMTPTTGATVGMGTILDASPSDNYGFVMVRLSSGGNLPLITQNATAGKFQNITEIFPITFASGDQIQIACDIPIV